MMADSGEIESMQYTEALFEHVLDWYKRAEFKAQLLLTLNGIFVSFLTTAVIRFPDSFANLAAFQSVFVKLLVTILCLLLALSIICALLCLRSRTYSTDDVDDIFKNEKIKKKDEKTYTPRIMHFFQFISQLDPPTFVKKLNDVDHSFAIETLGLEIYYLSVNTRKKHQWVNWGFVCAGSALIVMLIISLSYLSFAPFN